MAEQTTGNETPEEEAANLLEQEAKLSENLLREKEEK